MICLNGIATSEITEAQAALLAHFVETYLPLTPAEQKAFEQLIQREEVAVMEFITPWERKGIEQGRTQEARDTLLEQLQEKFAAVPETTPIHRVRRRFAVVASANDPCQFASRNGTGWRRRATMMGENHRIQYRVRTRLYYFPTTV